MKYKRHYKISLTINLIVEPPVKVKSPYRGRLG